MDLHSVLKVDEVGTVLSLQFGLSLEWTDHRVAFLNLKESLNVLTQTEQRMLWAPEVVFDNTVDKGGTVMDDKTLFMVERRGPHDPFLGSMSKLYNDRYFAGRDALLRTYRYACIHIGRCCLYPCCPRQM